MLGVLGSVELFLLLLFVVFKLFLQFVGQFFPVKVAILLLLPLKFLNLRLVLLFMLLVVQLLEVLQLTIMLVFLFVLFACFLLVQLLDVLFSQKLNMLLIRHWLI